MNRQVVIGLNAAIVAVTDEAPRILTVRHAGASRRGAAARHPEDALPFGPFEPARDRTLELGLRRWIREQTGLEVGYVEQLYTFGDRNRDPSELRGGPRVLSIAYIALVREARPSGNAEAQWQDCYRYLPWEDWRSGRPPILERHIAPALDAWRLRGRDLRARKERRERIDINFGFGGARWDGERVLERFELLYESGLASEAHRDRVWRRLPGARAPLEKTLLLGRSMSLDHRRILATALGRLRGKVKYRPVVFELLPATFTLLQLQRVVEALAGVRLHKQNLRRLVEKGGLVEGTGVRDAGTGGRPAELFRFRREVLRERPAPGVGLPRAATRG